LLGGNELAFGLGLSLFEFGLRQFLSKGVLFGDLGRVLGLERLGPVDVVFLPGLGLALIGLGPSQLLGLLPLNARRLGSLARIPRCRGVF